MRTGLLLLGLAVACAGDDDVPSTFCDDLMANDAGCMNEDNLAECKTAQAECPGNVLVMESCPLQFGCG
jgi:hypothetical protein